MKKKFAKMFISIGILFAFVQILFVFVLPFVLNLEITKNQLEKLIEKQTLLDCDLKKLKFSAWFDFSLRLQAKEISAKTKQAKNFLDCENFDLQFGFPNLFTKKIQVKKFSTSKLSLNILRNKNGKFNFEGIIVDNQGFKPVFRKTNLNLEDLKVSFDDRFLNKNTLLNIPYIKILNFDENKQIDILTKGSLNVNNKTSHFNLKVFSVLPFERKNFEDKLNVAISVNNLDLQSFSPYVFEFLKCPSCLLKGNVNLEVKSLPKNGQKFLISNLNINEVFLKTEQDTLKLEGLTKISNIVKFEKRKIANFESKISNNDFSIVSEGFFEFNKNKEYKVSVRFKDASIEKLLSCLPFSLNGKEINEIKQAKKFGVFGNLNGEIVLNGHDFKPMIFGNIEANNVFVVSALKNVPFAKVKANFKGDRFELNAHVPTSQTQCVNVEGFSMLYGEKNGSYKIKSTDKIDLKTAMHSLIPIKHIVGFKLGPLPFMTLQGLGNIDLFATGTLEKGFLTGVFNFENAIGTYQGLNAKLNDASGVLKFQNEKMLFETKHAKLENFDCKIKGIADIYGNFDFDVLSDEIELEGAYKIVKSSKILSDYSQKFAELENAYGKSNLGLNLKGKIIENDSDMLKNCKICLNLDLNNAKVKIKSLSDTISGLFGKIKYDNDNLFLNLYANENDCKLSISTLKANKLHIDCEKITIEKASNLLFDLIRQKNNINKKDLKLLSGNIRFNLDYFGDLNKFDFQKIKLKGNFLPLSNESKKLLNFEEGIFEAYSDNLVLKNIKTSFQGGKLGLDGKVQNVFSARPICNLKILCSNFNLASLNNIKNSKLEIGSLRTIFNVYDNFKGNANFNITCKNNNLEGKLQISDSAFLHTKLRLPIEINYGVISFHNQDITIDSLVGSLDKAPIFFKGRMHNISNPVYNGYFTIKLSENLINSRVNSLLVYPVKVKNDVSFYANINGNKNALQLISKLKLNPQADITYMGSSFSDDDSLRELYSDMVYEKNVLKIKSLEYFKYETSQNDRTYPVKMLQMNGNIAILPDNTFDLKSFHVETIKPNEAKLLNIIFKKSLFKDGKFVCNIDMRGKTTKPEIFGTFTLENAIIPNYETQIRKLDLNFNKNIIKILMNSRIIDTYVNIKANAKDFVSLPVKLNDVEVSIKEANIDKFIDFLSSQNSSFRKESFISSNKNLITNSNYLNPKDFIINKANIKIDDVIINNQVAKEFKTKINFTDNQILKADEIFFTTLSGQVFGNASYDIANDRLKADLTLKNVDANDASNALLELDNQIYGNLNGNAKIETSGETYQKRLENLKGNVKFEITNGKMPKMGALEYLLRADNIVRSGFLRMTLNSVIDLVVPARTGYFSSISGNLDIFNGKAKGLEIFSKGENLSIYIVGDYDFAHSHADLDVYGRLSKSILSALGPVGNASLTSLFMLIPGVDDKMLEQLTEEVNKIPNVSNNQKGRIFQAKLQGDLNQEGYEYVKSFKWLYRE